jgi:tungstate transport system substrate-binding protein
VEVLKIIADKKAVFVSRGDESGTHQKEREIWKESGMSPQGTWYMETGQGMGPTLQVANEKQGYCLTDRGTYLAFKDKIELPILCEGDPRLFNPYGVIAVSPAVHPDAQYIYAMALIGWFTSPECQKMIGEFKKFGEVLFTPSAYPSTSK